MSTAYRIRDEQAIYFLTMTIRHWIDLFTRASYKWEVVDSLKYCQNEKGLMIHAWCLMPSHLHMIVQTKEGFNLSAVIRDIKKYTSRRLLTMIKQESESRREWLLRGFVKKSGGHKVWQSGNQAKECVSEEFTFQKIDYIHDNPVQSQVVDRADKYMFSSATDYSGGNGILGVVTL